MVLVEKNKKDKFYLFFFYAIILNILFERVDTMELRDIDVKIFNCDACHGMVYKFEGDKTVSIGNKTDIVLVGEAPACNGWRKSGIPWYDVDGKLIPSGVVLKRLLSLIDYNLSDTCFLETVKCYPKNKKFLQECILNCRKYLFEQLSLLDPKIILPLGDVATRSLLNIKYNRLSDVVGNVYDYHGHDVIPIYHPSPISPLSYEGNVDIFENVIKRRVRILK